MGTARADAVVIVWLLHLLHLLDLLDDATPAIAEAAREPRPGGVLVMTVAP